MTDHQRDDFRAVRGVFIAFLIGTAGAIGLGFAFALDLGTQWLGLTLAVAFSGIGYGLVAWGHRLMPPGGAVEERKLMSEVAESEGEIKQLLEESAGGIQRRGLLGGALAAALGATGIAALFPLRSLGPRPEDDLRWTAYSLVPRPRLVTSEGLPIHRDELPVGAFLTVFPEGHAGAADAQTALMRLPDDAEIRPPTRAEWIAASHIAYSKICTHAGCPVGLYQVEEQVLICPCHQSTFSVVEGGEPSLGPAARALPQLPLGVDDQGFLIATGDYPEAVGSGWWTRPSDTTDDSGTP